MAKNYASTYLYKMYPEYSKVLIDFVLNGTVIDKSDKSFEDIRYEVKRRSIDSSLLKVLDSPKVELLISSKPISKAFKVFVANDIKNPKVGPKGVSLDKSKSNMKVYIDCSDIIRLDNGVYKCSNVNILTSYLMSAMMSYIYMMDERTIITASKLTMQGATAFSSLFTYIVDYICKISVNPSARAKCIHLSALYYISNILGKDIDEKSSGYTVACKISGLSSREAELLKYDITDDSFKNINEFVTTVASALKLSSLKTDLFVEKWMYLYGTGTVFALELFPAFSTMLTDTYIGAYINNQKTIQNCAKQSMVEFTKTCIQIGAGV